ncbi:hypothetical protein QL987_00965, partial [Curtobacterium sp. APC 4022]|nr:hypothetical protein [Curtobacterium sp. APC 4022]
RFEEARAVLSRSYDAFRAAGAPAERTEALRTAVEAALRASMTQPAAEPEAERPRTARDFAVRTDAEPAPRAAEPATPLPTTPRRVLGAPDAARTEGDSLWGRLARPSRTDRDE